MVVFYIKYENKFLFKDRKLINEEYCMDNSRMFY